MIQTNVRRLLGLVAGVCIKNVGRRLLGRVAGICIKELGGDISAVWPGCASKIGRRLLGRVAWICIKNLAATSRPCGLDFHQKLGGNFSAVWPGFASKIRRRLLGRVAGFRLNIALNKLSSPNGGGRRVHRLVTQPL